MFCACLLQMSAYFVHINAFCCLSQDILCISMDIIAFLIIQIASKCIFQFCRSPALATAPGLSVLVLFHFTATESYQQFIACKHTHPHGSGDPPHRPGPRLGWLLAPCLGLQLLAHFSWPVKCLSIYLLLSETYSDTQMMPPCHSSSSSSSSRLVPATNHCFQPAAWCFHAICICKQSSTVVLTNHPLLDLEDLS